MPGERIQRGKQGGFVRAEDGPAVQGDEVPRHVGRNPHFGRDLQLVSARDRHQALVEDPVTEFAQGHAVVQVIVVSEAPRDDMSRLDHAVPIDGNQFHAAKRTAVLVNTGNGASEALVADNLVAFDRLQRNFLDFVPGFVNQLLAVSERFGIQDNLVQERGLAFGGKVGFHQRHTQGVARFFGLEQGVEFFVQGGAQDEFFELAERANRADGLERVFLAGLGEQMPEIAAAQVEEGQGQVSRSLGRHDTGPVRREGFAQFGGDFDEVSLDLPLGKQIQDGEQQERLVRRARFGDIRPAAGAVCPQAGEGLEVVGCFFGHLS